MADARTSFLRGVAFLVHVEPRQVLKGVAGDQAFLLFALGIIGTGMLAVPVLAGSAAYAVAEAAGWPGSLSLRLEKCEGRGFYGIVAAAMLGGVILCFTPASPVQELFWSAVLNGIVAVPIMAVMMLLASHPQAMRGIRSGGRCACSAGRPPAPWRQRSSP